MGDGKEEGEGNKMGDGVEGWEGNKMKHGEEKVEGKGNFKKGMWRKRAREERGGCGGARGS